ncbi:DHA1 family inner membrane transport protein [Stella humosa]|uniref:DHA1 family inner membrane transport protein n=1 Tax=Stella humosa TaxID=94 RepID=A0A3N1L3K2_9PROT|nr:DHA1 family inner membrane transport protein [Stella humosa]BBK33494.1 MFS transporter [Stella humosa]
MKLNPAIMALAVGAFGIGVTEFSPMGMLPTIATDLEVSIPTAGLLVSAYAFGVLVGAPLLTMTTARVPRRTLLIAMMGIFTVGNLLAALSGGYGTLLFARVFTSLSHGAFFGVGSVVAARLVPADKRAGAVAAMFMGLTIANVAGVPLAAWAAEQFGWRAVFWAVTGLGLAAMTALRLALPDMAADAGADMRAELRVLGRRPVLSALLLTVIGSIAMFTVFTYFAPILQEETGASNAFVAGMLVVYGLGLTLGNWLGGRYADRSVDGTLIATLAGMTLLLGLFAVGMRWPLPAAVLIFLWGIASFALVPPLQMRVMQAAGDAPNLASAMNIGAFNLGNALGAAMGGAVIDAGLGYPAVAAAGAAMAATGLALVLALKRGARPYPGSIATDLTTAKTGSPGRRPNCSTDRRVTRATSTAAPQATCTSAAAP